MENTTFQAAVIIAVIIMPGMFTRAAQNNYQKAHFDLILHTIFQNLPLNVTEYQKN